MASKGYSVARVHVDGMTCGRCVNYIESNMAEIQGVHHIKVDLEQKEATVSFDRWGFFINIKGTLIIIVSLNLKSSIKKIHRNSQLKQWWKVQL